VVPMISNHQESYGNNWKVSAVESKPASDGRIKTSHFFCLNRAGIFWQEVILHWGLIHRKASERSGFEVVLFGCSYFSV
jgi:hypothetical protein